MVPMLPRTWKIYIVTTLISALGADLKAIEHAL